MAEAKNQHYVPQFLLRNFADSESGVLHAFDKRTGKSFGTNPRNVAAERFFYDFDTEWGTVTIEPGLAALEAKAAGIIDRILQAESLASIQPDDRVLLSVFFAVQLTRTRHMRDAMLDLSRQLAKWLEKLGLDPNEVKNFKPMKEPDAKLLAMQLTDQARSEFAPHFLLKTWVLLRNRTQDPLIVSDNPIALHNSQQDPMVGRLGLASPGIEIHIPLSPRIALNLLCPSLEGQIRRNHDILLQLVSRDLPLFLRMQQEYTFTEKFIRAVEAGEPLDITPENVQRENSLQVISAERYVFSSCSDFTLPQQMIEKEPELARGRRLKLG